jgi:hypothetical protein
MRASAIREKTVMALKDLLTTVFTVAPGAFIMPAWLLMFVSIFIFMFSPLSTGFFERGNRPVDDYAINTHGPTWDCSQRVHVW